MVACATAPALTLHLAELAGKALASNVTASGEQRINHMRTLKRFVNEAQLTLRDAHALPNQHRWQKV